MDARRALDGDGRAVEEAVTGDRPIEKNPWMKNDDTLDLHANKNKGKDTMRAIKVCF